MNITNHFCFFADIQVILITLNVLEKVVLELFLKQRIRSMGVIMLSKEFTSQTGIASLFVCLCKC